MAGSVAFAVAEGITGCPGSRLSEMQVADEHPSFVNPLNGTPRFPCPASIPIPFTVTLHNENGMFCQFICEFSIDRLGQLQLSSQDQSCS